MKKLILTALASLSVCTPCHCAEKWCNVFVTTIGLTYVQQQTITQDGDTKSAWFATVMIPKPDQTEDFIMERVAVDCKKRMLKRVYVYSELKGKETYSGDPKDEWIPVVPHKIGQAAYDVVCSHNYSCKDTEFSGISDLIADGVKNLKDMGLIPNN